MDFIYELKIPKERVAILIGKNGGIKREIEKSTNSKIRIDSKEGDVTIKSDDGVGLFTAKQVIIAIGRGFNPGVAMLLLKPDYEMVIININDYARTKKSLIRLKGRVIGEKGKSRRKIEELTDTDICVYGKTITIIGKIGDVDITRRAIESLLKGSQHKTVFNWLEKRKKEKSIERMFDVGFENE